MRVNCVKYISLAKMSPNSDDHGLIVHNGTTWGPRILSSRGRRKEDYDGLRPGNIIVSIKIILSRHLQVTVIGKKVSIRSHTQFKPLLEIRRVIPQFSLDSNPMAPTKASMVDAMLTFVTSPF